MIDTKPKQPFEYEGFASPNGTVVPDDVFDVLAPELSEAELRVLLYIVRRTFGFKRDRDAISLSQMVDGIKTRDGRVLDKGTGMSRRGVMKGCAGLAAKKIITVEKRMAEQGDNEINIYSLRFRETQENNVVAGVGNEMPYGREQGAPRVGNESAPQQTGIQQTEISLSNIRKSTRSKNHFVDNSISQPISLEEPDSPPSLRTHGMEGVGEIMTRRRGRPPKSAAAPAPVQTESISLSGTEPKRKRGRPRKLPNMPAEEYEGIIGIMTDFSRKLGDFEHVQSNITQAINIMQEAGCDLNTFYMAILDAHRETAGKSKIQNRMGYFFRVLRDRLSLDEVPMQQRLAN